MFILPQTANIRTEQTLSVSNVHTKYIYKIQINKIWTSCRDWLTSPKIQKVCVLFFVSASGWRITGYRCFYSGGKLLSGLTAVTWSECKWWTLLCIVLTLSIVLQSFKVEYLWRQYGRKTLIVELRGWRSLSFALKPKCYVNLRYFKKRDIIYFLCSLEGFVIKLISLEA